jgi:DNA-binding NtrC family response regulator
VSGPEANGAAVRQLHPVRVLLISNDRRFRAMAEVLLGRRGCVVSSIESATGAVELVQRHRANVIVIDAGHAAAAARRLASLKALLPSVGVVLVADAPDTWLESLAVEAKWGPFPRLYAAVQQAYRQSRDRRGEIVA